MIDLLFYEALQQPADKRRSWLEQKCSDQQLLNEVLTLLNAHEKAGEFLQHPINLEYNQHLKVDLLRRQLGPYFIDTLIAHGGMGRVYRAHRVDGEYEQQVAIKLIESAHIDTELLRHERQILADLHHPNIVSLLDGGTLEEGIPYLVMEYVRGQPIHDFVREQGLNEQQIIRLFCSLVSVISLIHQHGIVHCDLKPDNILITERGDLKLLDFGVAHYLATVSENANTLSAMTPEYASVQRRNHHSPEVTDDIYSLGVLLGVLLTGHKPEIQHTSETVFDVNYSLIESQLSQEMKAVFLKATHPDTTLRYHSVDKLNADLFRWFDQLPLLAMENVPVYRIQKWLLRNRYSIVAGTILLLVTGMAISLHGQQQKTEQTQATIVAQVDATLKELDDRLEKLKGSTQARITGTENTLNRLEKLSEGQTKDQHLTRIMADAHLKLGELLGHLFHLHLGEFQRSRKHLQQALVLYQEILALDPENFSIAMQYAKAQRMLVAQMVFLDGKTKQGLAKLLKTRDWLNQLQPNNLYEYGQLAVQCLAIAHLHTRLGQLRSADEDFRMVEKLLLQSNEETSDYEREHNKRIYNFFLDEKAAFELASQNYPAAEHAYHQALQKYQNKPFWRDRRRVSRANYALACIGLIRGKPVADARSRLFQAREIAQSIVQEYPNALSPQWELVRYSGLKNDTLYTRENWIKAFNCEKAYQLIDPPVPVSAEVQLSSK